MDYRWIGMTVAVLALLCLGLAPTGAAQQDCTSDPAYTATWEIQGSGHTSPMNGDDVDDVRGIVTADYQTGTGGPDPAEGFYIQAHEPDCEAGTSDGLFVFTGDSALDVTVGDLVSIDGGTVDEFQGPGGGWDRTLTELVCTSGCSIEVRDADRGRPAPVDYAPPANASEDDVKEDHEGMLVEVADPATVITPDTDFDEATLVRSNTSRHHADAGEIAEIVVDGGPVDASECDQSGLPELKTLDLVEHEPGQGEGILGPLTYGFGVYKVQQDAGNRCLAPEGTNTDAYEPSANPPPERAGNLTIATFNVRNLFDTQDDGEKADPVASQSELDRETTQVARTICDEDGLDRPLIVGVQEIENQNVLDDIVSDIDTECSATYTAHNVAGPSDRSIENGYLLHESVTVDDVRQRQGCSDRDRGIDYESGDADPSVDCPDDEPHFLHARPPVELVANVTVGDATREVHVLNNHFKSKLSSSNCDAENCSDWRIEEARHVNDEAERVHQANPDALVVVLGDMNAQTDEAPLEELDQTRGSLANTVRDLAGPPGDAPGDIERYTYIFDAKSQALDHLLVGSNLDTWNRTVSVRHTNADWPASRSDDPTMFGASDHDPLVVAFQPPGEAPAPANQEPNATFTADCTLTSCTFDARESSDPDGEITRFAWELGDGTNATGAVVNHTYDKPGTYRVTLTVIDDANARDTTAKNVTASPLRLPLINEFNANPPGQDVLADEWVELFNPGPEPVDLDGWQLESNLPVFATYSLDGRTLPGEGFLDVAPFGPWLPDEDARVTLRNATGAIVDRTPRVSDTASDGLSHQRRWDGADEWVFEDQTRSSTNTEPIVTEIEANPDGVDPGNEWVEVHNPSAHQLNLDGWRLRTTSTGTVEHVFETGSLDAGQFQTVGEDEQWLDNGDESIRVLRPDGTHAGHTRAVSDHADDERTWQRVPDVADSWVFASTTMGASNE